MSFDVLRFSHIGVRMSRSVPGACGCRCARAGWRHYGVPMRWDALFADLEGQFETERAAGLAAEVVDLTRAELASITLVDRLCAQVGSGLVCWLVDDERVEGPLLEVGADWVLIGDDGRARLLPLAAVAAVSGLTRAAEAPVAGPVSGRLPLTALLRRLARDRAPVELRMWGGRACTGTVDRVAADHVDVTVRRLDDPTRGPVERLALPIGMVLQIRLR